MSGATLGEERWDKVNFSATLRAVTSELQNRSVDRTGEKKLCYLPVMPSDDNNTGPSLLALLDLVDFIEAFSLVGLFQLLSELIVADCASVNYGFWRKEILIVISMKIATTKIIPSPQLLGQYSGQHHRPHKLSHNP